MNYLNLLNIDIQYSESKMFFWHSICYYKAEKLLFVVSLN